MTRLTRSNDEPSGPQSPADKSPLRKRTCAVPPGLGRCALRAGEHAPRFRLPDQHGHMVSLSGLLTKGPVVLRFCRRSAPSYFHELDGLAALYAEIKKWGATLAVIVAQQPLPHPEDKHPDAYAFLLLTDKGAKVARSYGLTNSLPLTGSPAATGADCSKSLEQPGGNGSAPATYIVDQNSIVALAFVDLRGGSWMEPDQIVMALECLSKRKELK
jgi:peroxiredoxin